MNWYKIAQEYPPIAIVSYIPSYGELGITFHGGKKYIYEKINTENYEYIRSLLRNKNYTEAQKVLSNWSVKNEETDADRREMLTELHDRGYLK